MCVDGVFCSVWGINGKLNGNTMFFPFCSKMFNSFSKVPWGKDSNTSVFTKQVEKISKIVLGKSFLCVKQIGRKTLSTHMYVDRSLWQTVQNLIAFQGLRYAMWLQSQKVA